MCKHPLQHARKLEEAQRASQASLGSRMRQFQNKNKRLSSDMHAQDPGFNPQHNEIQRKALKKKKNPLPGAALA